MIIRQMTAVVRKLILQVVSGTKAVLSR